MLGVLTERAGEPVSAATLGALTSERVMFKTRSLHVYTAWLHRELRRCEGANKLIESCVRGFVLRAQPQSNVADATA